MVPSNVLSALRHYAPAVLLAAAAAGCGRLEYFSVVSFDAKSAVDGARRAGAGRLAPYESTAAIEYLHKARELAGFSRYERAIEYGAKARGMAEKARSIARDKSMLPAEAKQE